MRPSYDQPVQAKVITILTLHYLHQGHHTLRHLHQGHHTLHHLHQGHHDQPVQVSVKANPCKVSEDQPVQGQ